MKTIKEIIVDDEVDIFDFDYTLNPLKDSDELEQAFIDRYYYKHIEYDDIEQFKHELKVLWRESLTNYNKKITANAIELNVIRNSSGDLTVTQVYNDMPDSAIDSDDYATTITRNTNAQSGYSGTTEAELLAKYYDNLRDIDSEFLDIFNVLFLGLYGYDDDTCTDLTDEVYALQQTVAEQEITIAEQEATISSQADALAICDEAEAILDDIIGGVL